MSKPVVIISRCLSGTVCRWDGQALDSTLYNVLQDRLTLIPFCPELELGLGCPRPTIRLIRKSFDVRTSDNIDLVQPQTGRILTQAMDDLCEKFLLTHPADGYILKYKSPSCGLTNVKVYMGTDSQEICGFESGRFAAAVRRLFPSAPAIDDFRLVKPGAMEEFVRKLTNVRGGLLSYKKQRYQRSSWSFCDSVK